MSDRRRRGQVRVRAWWRRRSLGQRLLVLAVPAFLAGVAVTVAVAVQHPVTGTGRIAVQAALLATPAGWGLLAAWRTGTRPAPLLWLLAAAAAVAVVGTALEIAAAYAGLVVAVTGYLIVTTPSLADAVVNGYAISHAVGVGCDRAWRALDRPAPRDGGQRR